MSQVYFLYAPTVHKLKIGRSQDPERRFAELKLLSPVGLEILGVVRGGAKEEALIHQKFSHLTSHGEWFHATEELLVYCRTENIINAWEEAGPEARQHAREYIDAPVMDDRFGRSA